MESHVDEEVESREEWNGDVCAGGWGGGDGFGGGDRGVDRVERGDWGGEDIFLIRGQFRRLARVEIEW